MGLLAPTKPYVSPDLVDETEVQVIGSVGSVLDTHRLARSTVSVVEWLEARLHPWTSFVIVPLFGLANAGISVSGNSLAGAFSSPVAWGVMIGLVVGKPIGILAFSAVAVRLGMASRPEGANWRGIGATGLLAGVGFTVSVFIAELALEPPALNQAKVAVLFASIVAGALGMFALAHSPSNAFTRGTVRDSDARTESR